MCKQEDIFGAGTCKQEDRFGVGICKQDRFETGTCRQEDIFGEARVNSRIDLDWACVNKRIDFERAGSHWDDPGL
jgi:hypothetical protein